MVVVNKLMEQKTKKTQKHIKTESESENVTVNGTSKKTKEEKGRSSTEVAQSHRLAPALPNEFS